MVCHHIRWTEDRASHAAAEAEGGFVLIKVGKRVAIILARFTDISTQTRMSSPNKPPTWFVMRPKLDRKSQQDKEFVWQLPARSDAKHRAGRRHHLIRRRRFSADGRHLPPMPPPPPRGAPDTPLSAIYTGTTPTRSVVTSEGDPKATEGCRPPLAPGTGCTTVGHLPAPPPLGAQ